MNFQDLLTKMKQLDECGEMSPMPPRQQDNVNMNVTMSGNGAGGIKDLLNILKNIEQGSDEPTGGDAVIIGGDDIADVEKDLDDSYNNEPNTEIAGVDAVTPTGNDLASKGDEAEKVNGGGNPWNQTEVDETLLDRLASHYSKIRGDDHTDENIIGDIAGGVGSAIGGVQGAWQGLKTRFNQGQQQTKQSVQQAVSGQAAHPSTLPAGRPGSPSANYAAKKTQQFNPAQVSGGQNDLW